MSGRYRPNEPTCPISLELLALLIRSPDERVAEIADAMPLRERAQLAIHCVARTHLRRIALTVAARCSEQALWEVGGRVGTALSEQCHDRAAFDREPGQIARRKVSLARVA